MKGVMLDAQRLARLAAGLREQIPHASPDVARPMIDAAGELQRLADEIVQFGQQNSEEAKKLHGSANPNAGECRCVFCQIRRGIEAQQQKAKPGDLN